MECTLIFIGEEEHREQQRRRGSAFDAIFRRSNVWRRRPGGARAPGRRHAARQRGGGACLPVSLSPTPDSLN